MGVWGGVVGGGVGSVGVGVQFQRHPSRRSKGGVNQNQSGRIG